MISKDLMASEDISGLGRPQWLQKASMALGDLNGLRRPHWPQKYSDDILKWPQLAHDVNWPHDLNDFKKTSLVSNDLYWPQVTSNWTVFLAWKIQMRHFRWFSNTLQVIQNSILEGTYSNFNFIMHQSFIKIVQEGLDFKNPRQINNFIFLNLLIDFWTFEHARSII